MNTPDQHSQVFAAFLALHIATNARGDIVMTQGCNTITFPAPLAGDVMHANQNIGYISRVSSEIGCGSPKARGAKPHPQGLRLFYFLTVLAARMGGLLPCRLRSACHRPSTPILAAAQRGSCSAVVLKAQLEQLHA